MAAVIPLAPAGSAYAGKTLYVTNYGLDGFFCGAKSNPFRSIGVAILLANEGDRIIVGPGFCGDLNNDGWIGGPFSGEEFERDSCGRMVLVDKRLTIAPKLAFQRLAAIDSPCRLDLARDEACRRIAGRLKV